MTRRIRTLTKNVLLCLTVATVVIALLYRTDHERIAEEVVTPYAIIEILPDSLEQRPIEGSDHWGLFYSIRGEKDVACQEVIVERIVQQIGKAFPVANNREIMNELVPFGMGTVVTPGLHVTLPSALEPGDYFMLLRATCFVRDNGHGRRALSPPAEAFVCFSVPALRPVPIGPIRLQPVSENCKRELAEIVLSSPKIRFVMSR